MAWTSPKTWSSEPLYAVDLNTYVRDNQNHIYDRLANGSYHDIDEASNYATSSASFVDVDGTDLSLTLTTRGYDVMVGFSGNVRHPTNGGDITYFDIYYDDSTYHGGDDGIVAVMTDLMGDMQSFSFVVIITGLSEGIHTFNLRWKTDGGDAEMPAGAGTSGRDLHPHFFAKEL